MISVIFSFCLQNEQTHGFSFLLPQLYARGALECFANPDLSSMHGVVAVEDICSGNWMSQLSADISMAWLQANGSLME